MRLIDADELIERAWRERLDSRERIVNLIESAPTVNPPAKCIAEIHCDVDKVVERIKQDYILPFQWIPTSERLPEEPYGCLVTVWDSTPTGEGDDFENLLPYFVGWDGEQWNDGDGQQCPFEVIAWQYLPEPYNEDKE